jgi:hypothetical protein
MGTMNAFAADGTRFEGRIGGRILFEFTTSPAGVESLGVLWDVTRQIKARDRFIRRGVIATPPGLPDLNFPDEDGNDNEQPNDDNHAGDEDNVPANRHIYSFDAPSQGRRARVNGSWADFMMRRTTFKEWTRVRLSPAVNVAVRGIPFYVPFTNRNGTVEGSRSAEKNDWHYIDYLRLSRTGNWVQDTAARSASEPIHSATGSGGARVTTLATAVTEGFTAVYSARLQRWTIRGTSGDSTTATRAGALPRGTQWTLTLGTKVRLRITQGRTAFANGDTIRFSTFRSTARLGKRNIIGLGAIDPTSGP